MARTRRLIHGLSSQMDENNPRGFMQIGLEVTGAEVGRIRFPKIAGDYQNSGDEIAPRIAQWRNNLTALSQYHNLYFVACSDEIHVYHPRFPDQKLGNKPVMIIKPPVSRPGLRGYIDPNHPHAANFLLVDDLGDEEVLAIACDDGDVVIYNTRSIANKLKSKMERGSSSEEADADQVKPFFHDHFHMSAWGLAMHKAGRMLAVSSNTRNIDVIAFALCSPSPHSSDASSDEGLEPHEMNDSASLPATSDDQRRDEHRVTLRGHGANIPCIAFCNNKADRHAQWLASTDIDGVLLVWNIWTQEIVARYEFGDVTHIRQPNAVWSERRRGWGVLCLDPGAFKVTSGLVETYGSSRVSTTKPVDTTCCRQEVKDSSYMFGFHVLTNDQAAFVVGGGDDDALLEEAEEDQDFEVTSDIEDEGDEDDDDGGDGDEDIDEVAQGAGAAVFNMSSLPDQHTQDLQVQAFLQGGLIDPFDPQFSSPGIDDQPEVEDILEEGQDSHDEEERADGNAKEGQDAAYVQHRNPDPPRFSIVHTTEVSVRLLSTPCAGPTAYCRRALHQDVPAALHFLTPLERLNMISYVPELSLLVVGNQMGRVGLFTLTCDPEDDVGLRLEFLLPFASQEREGMRPGRPLLGVAIGPIQGREKVLDPHGFDETSPRRNREQLWNRVEKTRRYRLMLTYNDFTVLSYEIGRDDHPAANPQGELILV